MFQEDEALEVPPLPSLPRRGVKCTASPLKDETEIELNTKEKDTPTLVTSASNIKSPFPAMKPSSITDTGHHERHLIPSKTNRFISNPRTTSIVVY
jgi:hypothetical protein